MGAYIQEMAAASLEPLDSSEFLLATGTYIERISSVWQDRVDGNVAGFLTPIRYQLGKIGAVKVE